MAPALTDGVDQPEMGDEPDLVGPRLEDMDQWVQIQAKTFKNWCNEQLKPANMEIGNIQTDFADGLLLIELMKCLMASRGRPLSAAKKRLSVKANPKREVEKMSNVQCAIDLMKEEGIKLINIGNEDIVKGNIKLILGLLWQLVNTYQFSGPTTTANKDGKKRAIPPKKLIQQWLQGILPEGVHCKNFTRDWNDGIVLSALLNYCDDSLFPDWSKLRTSDGLANCEAALSAANERFQIPVIVSAADMSSPEVDELSVITYVSYFVQHEAPGWYATLNWIRSKVTERNVTNFQEDFNDGLVLCALSHAVGENCEGWQDLDPTDKLANCQRGLNAGKELGVKPTLSATDLSQPDVNELGVMAYSAGYHKAKSSTRTKSETPKPAKVDWGRCARFSLDEIVGAQYSQEVATNTKGLVAHKGVINEVIVVKIRIVSDRAIATDISAQVDAPGESVPISLKKISDDLVEASVLPLNEGIHTINIRCRNELIEGCPIRIMVMRDDSSFPENVKVGKITTAVVGEELQFQVDVAEAGKGELTVTISNGLHELPVRLEQNGAMFTIFTIADAVGDYNVNILWDRNPVTDEPAKLRVYDPNRVTVSGEGLTRGREGTPAKFIVDPRNAGFAELKVSVEGPNSMAKVTVSRNEDKTYTVTYVPTEVGFFNINVQYGGRPIYGAPFRAKITDPRKVRFSGLPALRNDDGSIDLHLRENYRIVLETDEAGPGDLHAEMETVNAILPLQVDSISSHRHSVLFAPPKEGKCVIRVRWSGSDIKGSPFVGYARQKETPIDHTKVKVHGEGIQSSKVYIPSEFVIDGSQAGAGKPSVNITGSSRDVNVKIESMKNMENMYKVSYMAEKAGTYIVYVAWSDKQIPDSPFRVAVEANPHAERVRASAMKGLVAHQTCKVLIDTRDAADGDLTAKCMGPTKPAEVSIGRNEEGLYQLFITPKEPGLHRLDVLYGEQHIQGSPFDLRVSAPPDAKKVRARGPGLNHGIIDTYNGRFICETRGAGAGQLKVRVHGPKGAFKVEMMRSSKKDRTIDVRYNPTEVGEYKVEVKWSDDQVPGSPFVVTVVDTPEELRHVRRENPIDPKYTTLTQGEWVEDL